ncbi:MAG: myo-inositol-1(or 4)-monophosphatase [Planctomycetota bacterium]|jgi:myo-inositol-1(or 4)-monophosphatase
MTEAHELGAEAAQFAAEVAVEAGELLLEHLGRLDQAAIRSKSAARDLVTAADVASERLIVQRIRKRFPSHAIEAEEEVHELGSVGPRWLVDPLDGTVNFVHGIPFFCVSMALYIGNQPLAAVVHLPVLRETFSASLGSGTTLNGHAVSVSKSTALADSILATGFPYRRGELEHDNLANFSELFYDVRGMRRCGSAAMDLAYTAAGRFDGFWELHLSAHDVAAGALLVREAGGVVTDGDGEEDWLYGGHIVAGGSVLQPILQARIAH